MVGWQHRLNGCEFEQSPGDNGGHRSLTCCIKELNTTQRLNDNNPELSPECGLALSEKSNIFFLLWLTFIGNF